MNVPFTTLLSDIKNCTLCTEFLPLGPRPVVSLSDKSKVLIIGQAPGIRVHTTGIPWNDPSGDQLRKWLDIDKSVFYDTSNFAIMPMAFCYPGTGPSGDLPPRKECAPQWHERILNTLPEITLTLLIGKYAQDYYLRLTKGENLTRTVNRFHEFLPGFFPLPHPSPRNRIWLKKNPWFETEVLPILREQVHAAIGRS